MLTTEEEFDYESLDPGIRNTVRKLNEAGFITVDSGDGEHKFNDGFTYGNGNKPDEDEAFTYPHVVISVDKENMVSETDRLAETVRSWGLDIWNHQVQLMYCPGDTPTIMLSGVNDQGIVEDDMMKLYREQRDGHGDTD